ncbi:hypothetical protein [Nocardioides abyssi]|uniref:Secreted protein n=1 Tax=Nocardioides abyssi TaxID=3058370 RepID=A0ABT8EPS5_9ACTN|nr:hypothetical protein [Nocardioides abyssi]MDN4160148.1 hypothetical protein [Nocardioides abyssi]
MARILRTLVALVLLVVPTAGLVASTSTTASAAPTYGPWSSEVLGLQGRVSPPSEDQARAFVQFRRTKSSEGQRQVRVAYRVAAGKRVTLAARSLAPGTRTQYRTAAVPCGKRITVVAQGRYRASESADWSSWYEVSATFKRAC